MSPVNFDSFVLNAATRHGIMLYILFALASLVLGFYVGVRMGRHRHILVDFPTLLLSQLATLCVFLAFAAVAGQFPREFWSATLAIGFTGWMIQWLLTWAASLSDIGKVSAEATIARAIVLSEPSFWMVVAGIFFAALSVLQLGLLIYCGFLFDPMQMGNSTYLAKIAAYSLVIPVALQLVPTLLVQG